MERTKEDIEKTYNQLKVKSIQIQSALKQSKRSALEAKLQIQDIKDKISKGESSILIQESSISIIKELIDRLSEEHISKITSLITYSLQTIFYDKDYKLEVCMGDKRNSKTAEFFLVENKKVNNVIKSVKSSFTDSIGGGILSVVGFVLQVYYIGYLNQANILFLDESFSQVSSEYIPNLMAFIKELSIQKGFLFILVSHDVRINSYADKTYLVKEGKVIEQIKEKENKYE